MQAIVPNLWFNANAEEAGQFYASVFPDTTTTVESRYPSEGLLDFQQPLAGQPLVVTVTMAGTRLSLINAGPEIQPNSTISFALNFDPQFFGGSAQEAGEALDRVWGELAREGTVLMALSEYPFSPRYGWVQDRYGISWQLSVTFPDAPSSEFLVPSLLFCGQAQNRAAEAVDFYLSVFGDGELGTQVFYTAIEGPVTTASVMYSDFTLRGQRFSAMDSGVFMDFTFTGGVSLEVLCKDQEEIDRLWEALSAHPEDEQCGWLRDRFGVSWQIVPANMGELMERPQAFEKLMQMKKIDIGAF